MANVPSSTTVFSELSRIQQSLKAPKSLSNDFAHFKYRSAEAILEQVKPLLGKCIINLTDEIVLVGDRYYVKSVVKLGLGQEAVSATAYARESLDKKGMDPAQITGASSSYARKYALCGLFAIDDASNDPDGKDNSDSEEKPKWKPQVQQTKPDIEGSKDRLIKAIVDSKDMETLSILEKKFDANSSIFSAGMRLDIISALGKRKKELEQ